jgi:hypothetical protein
MAEPQFRPPAARKTKPLPPGSAPQFEFKGKDKPKTGKQLFREKLLSDEGMLALHQRVATDPKIQKGKDTVTDLKRVLWHMRDWQHALFPRMKFEAFVGYTALVKTYRHDIEETLAKVAAPEPEPNAAPPPADAVPHVPLAAVSDPPSAPLGPSPTHGVESVLVDLDDDAIGSSAGAERKVADSPAEVNDCSESPMKRPRLNPDVV